jgi:hypothetical protein
MKISIAVIVIGLIGVFSFQNCAQSNFEGANMGLESIDNPHHGEMGFHCDHTGCHDYQAPKQETKYYTQIGNATYVASVLEEVFNNAKAPNNNVSKIINDKILKNRLFFGGKCHTHDDRETCIANDSYNNNYSEILSNGYANLSQHGGANSSREGYRLQACDELIKDPSIATIALGNAGVTPNSPFDWEHVGRLFRLFYPEIDDGYPVQKLGEISESIDAESKEEKWTKLLSVVCYSSGWQYY